MRNEKQFGIGALSCMEELRIPPGGYRQKVGAGKEVVTIGRDVRPPLILPLMPHIKYGGPYIVLSTGDAGTENRQHNCSYHRMEIKVAHTTAAPLRRGHLWKNLAANTRRIICECPVARIRGHHPASHGCVL